MGQVEAGGFRASRFAFPQGVANGTRTRNHQNHNLELYH